MKTIIVYLNADWLNHARKGDLSLGQLALCTTHYLQPHFSPKVGILSTNIQLLFAHRLQWKSRSLVRQHLQIIVRKLIFTLIWYLCSSFGSIGINLAHLSHNRSSVFKEISLVPLWTLTFQKKKERKNTISSRFDYCSDNTICWPLIMLVSLFELAPASQQHSGSTLPRTGHSLIVTQ